ncbi:MAG: glycosyltransferase family 2 protein [Candidatus Abyssubacteria bacterium]
MPDTTELSVVIPAYNEAERIGVTIERVSSYLKTRGLDYEIIIVSDGSSDSTERIVESYARENGRIRLVSYMPNRGKGFAVRTGILQARAKDVLFSDADLATPLEELETLERSARGCSIVVGSRALKDSTIIGWRPWYRELSGKIFNLIVRLVAVPGIRDTQCGFKLFKDGSAQRIFSIAQANGFAFDVEALFLARKLGYGIAEVGVSWNNSPLTKVSVFKHTLPMIFEIFKVRVNDWKKRYEPPAHN